MKHLKNLIPARLRDEFTVADLRWIFALLVVWAVFAWAT